jgi:PPOX class probable F420-dependent enzyme
VAKSGQPVPRLVWFYFDGIDLTVYSMPQAAKVAHVKAHPEVSLNLDSDGNGGGIIVVGGTARVDATDVDGREDAPYWAKYREAAERVDLAEGFAAFSTRLKITPTRVWTTPA